MNLLLTALLIGSLQVTAYRSISSQTDKSPYITSIGERVNNHGVAISQDLLAKNGGPLNYGDLLYIEGVGFKVVNDCMNKKFTNRLDVWVDSYDNEHRFHLKFKNKKLRVWVVHSVLKETTNDK